MLRQSTRPPEAVFNFPGAEPRHGNNFEDHGGRGVGFPHVRCRFADQCGIMGTESGSVSKEPFILPFGPGTFISPRVFVVRLEDGSDRDVDLFPRSVSESSERC
jgi:hypothetical protein